MYEFFKPVSFLSPPLLHIAIFIISSQKSYRASREYLNSLRLFDCLLVFKIRNFVFFFYLRNDRNGFDSSGDL